MMFETSDATQYMQWLALKALFGPDFLAAGEAVAEAPGFTFTDQFG